MGRLQSRRENQMLHDHSLARDITLATPPKSTEREGVADGCRLVRRVDIGCRWRPGPIERRDTGSGFFGAVNPHCHTLTDITVQRALLKPVRNAAVAARIEMARKATRVGEVRRG